MRLIVNILLLVFTALLSLASGFEADKRALGVADIPPCGVRRPKYTSCSTDIHSLHAFCKPYLLLDAVS